MEPPGDDTTSFRRSPPGIRFQNRYARHRSPGNRRSMIARVASLLLGFVLAVLGVAMLILPGPGVFFLAMAGALFASESLPIARALDGIEVRGRAAWRRLRRKPAVADRHHD